jgi:hypothetical protein
MLQLGVDSVRQCLEGVRDSVHDQDVRDSVQDEDVRDSVQDEEYVRDSVHVPESLNVKQPLALITENK